MGEVEAKDIAIAGGAIAAAVTAVGALLYFLTQKPPGVLAEFAGFQAEAVETGTTTRQSTGETARDFQFYPLINVTPDINGNFTVAWRYVNYLDGAQTVDSGTITNVFTGLIAGAPVQLQLVDTRPTPPRDPERNGSIAIGDKDFAGLGKQDGEYHSFTSQVTVTVTSPSGTSKSVSGSLQDNFKSVGALSVGFAGFALIKVTGA